MAGRDFSAELFGSEAKPVQGRDFSVELFGKQEPPGFFSNIGNLLVQGGKQALAAAEMSPSVLAGNVGQNKAALLAKQLAEPSTPQPAELKEIKGAFKDEAQDFEKAQGFFESAKAFGPVLLEIGKQALTNPKGLMYMTAEQAANMAPSMAGMIAGGRTGAMVGAAVPLPFAAPVGTAVGAAVGAFSGSVPMEVGSEFIGLVGKELAARELPATEDNIAALLRDTEFMATATKNATTKGVTTAGVDAAMSAVTGGLASAPRRAAVKAATAELGAAADAAKIAERTKSLLAQRTLGQKIGTGAGAVGSEVAGGGLSEAAGQQAAYGKVDIEDVAQEMLGGLGGSALQVPASAYAMTRDLATGKPTPVTSEAPIAPSVPAEPTTPTAPAEPIETPIQKQIAEQTGIAEAPPIQPTMLSSEEAAAQRMPMLQAKIEADMAAQEERARREGPRPVVPEVAPVETSRFDTEQPQLTTREELLAKQADIDRMRLDAGLPTGESSLTPGVQPDVTAPTEVLTPKIVDNRPLEAGAAKNRLLVMRNMLKNEGGDPESLTIISHPTVENRFAIQSLDVPARFTPEMQGNKNETGRVRETTVTRMDETGKPYTETTETPAGPGIEIDPIKTYIDIARRTNTPASMRLVKDFESGLVTRDDVQAAIDAEQKAGRPLPLNYTQAGEPWFLAPETSKPRGERELPPSSRLTRETPQGPTRPGEIIPPQEPPPQEPPTPPEEEPPEPTGTTPQTLGEFKQIFPIEDNRPAIRDAHDNGSFRQLADVMASSKNPAVKRIGELSRAISGKVKLLPPGKQSKNVLGRYRYVDDSIQMAPKAAGSEWVSAHESVHALIALAQRTPTARQVPIVADINKLFLHVKKELNRQGKGWGSRYSQQVYGLANELEFTAEAMSNPEFQFMLMQIPYAGKRSAWTQFTRLVADLLGIKNTNALTEVMNLTDKLAQTPRPKYVFNKDITSENSAFEGVTPQEREANFKKWFGNSKIVDEQGKPLQVYHGTKRDFKEFKTGYGDGLFFFSTNPEFASKWPVGTGGLRQISEDNAKEYEKIRALEKELGNKYMNKDYDFDSEQGVAEYDADRQAVKDELKQKTGYSNATEFENKAGIRVMPLYLSIQKPFDPRTDYKKIEPLLRDQGKQNLIDGDYHKSGNWLVYENKDVIEGLKRLGYDGIWLAENIGGPHETIAAFSNTQIKSATGNRGTYNPEVPDIEALSMPSFGKKPTPPKPTDVGKQAMDIVSQTGMQAAPPPLTKTQIAQQVIAKVKEDPALTVKTAKAALQRALDKFETSMFSGDAAFNNEIRRNLMKDFQDNPDVLGMLLEASQSQTVHSDALATQFIVDGGIAYDKETNKWVSVKKEDNFIKLAKSIETLQQKYNLTKEDAERVAHTYFVAKRFKSLEQKQTMRNAEISQLEAQIKREQNNSKLTPAQRESIVKGLRSDIKKLEAAEVYISDEQRAMIKPGVSLGSLMPELEKISDTWQGIRVNAIKAMVDGGLWNMQTAEAMLDNIDYVPFYREDQLEEGKGPQEFIKGLEVKAKEYKLKGSNSAVNDVFDNMVRWTQYAINRSVRNSKAVQMVDLATEINVGDEKMAKKVDEMDKDKNIVRVFRNGVQELYEVADPLYMDAFTAISNVAMPNIKFFSFMADLLRKSVVLSPIFSLAQVPSDAFSAIFSSGLKTPYALSIPARAVKEFITTMVKSSATHNLLKQYGATGVRDFNATIARQDVEIAAGLKAPKGLKGNIMEGLSHIAMSADNAVRQAVYEASMAQGLSKSEAIEKAFEVINFRRRGTNKTVNVLGQTVPFFYAYMSVQRVAIKTLTGTGISPQSRGEALKTLAYTSAAVMALSMLYTMANGGDDEYEKTPVAVRDRTLHVPGTMIRIPLRPDFFLFPKIVAEHLYHLITDKGLTDGAKFRKSLGENLANSVLSPQPIPQAIKPLLEVGINHDFFQGRPIVGPFDKKKEAERQFNDNTSELSKVLGSGLGASPMMIDHVIRGMFGSLGGMTMYATNFMIHSDPNVERPTLSFRDAMAGIPGTSGFITRANESRLKNDFYELRDVVEKANATYKDIEKRSPQGIDDFLKDEKNLMRLGLVKDVESITRELSGIRNAVTQISNAPKDMFTGEQKETRIKELRDLEAQMMKSIPVSKLREMAKM